MGEQEGFRTYYPTDKAQFPMGSDTWEALNAGYQVTMNFKNPFIYESWDPKAGTLRDIFGNIIGSRDRPFEAVDVDRTTVSGSTTFTPDDIPEDIRPDIKELLEKGYQVTVSFEGVKVDIWDPETKQLYNKKGEIIGERDHNYLTEIASFISVDYENADQFGIDDALVAWFLDLQSEFGPMLMTVDSDKSFVEVWQIDSGIIFDRELKETGKRTTPFNARTTRRFGGSIITYKPTDQLNTILGSEVKALLAAGNEVTLDGNQRMIDIWNPATSEVKDSDGIIRSFRGYPFPSENNLESIRMRIGQIESEIDGTERFIEIIRHTGLPAGWILIGTENGIDIPAPTEALRDLTVRIRDWLGDFKASVNPNGIIELIMDLPSRGVWAVIDNDLSTSNFVYTANKNELFPIDPNDLNASIAELRESIAKQRSDLHTKKTKQLLMKKARKKVNVNKLAKTTNR